MKKTFTILALAFLSLISILAGCVSVVEVKVDEVTDTVYVSSSGDDNTGRGTKTSPVRTLDKALQIADEKSSVQYILIENVTYSYTSPTTLSVRGGLSIKGGYNSSFDSVVGKTTFRDLKIVVNGDGVLLENLIFDGSSSRLVIQSVNNVTVSSCSFVSNFSAQNGGSIYVYNSGNVVIKDSNIFYGRANGFGGGIYVESSSSIVIQRNTITNCIADADADNVGSGGAITVVSTPSITIKDNQLRRSYSLGSGAIDSVITFKINGSNPNVIVDGNTISGLSVSSTYGIYEEDFNLTGHKIINNVFDLGTLTSSYYDYANGSLTIIQLNSGDAGTSVASNNSSM